MSDQVITGLYIRAQIAGRWCSVDIGDPALSDDQFCDWLVTLDKAALICLADTLRRVIVTAG